MKLGIAAFALAAFAALLGVSIWASGQQSVVLAINDLIANPAGSNNPWLLATLFDAYFGFLWFWLWVAYKESSWLARAVWLLLILLGGNLLMAIYMLIQLWRLPTGAGVEQLLLRRPSV